MFAESTPKQSLCIGHLPQQNQLEQWIRAGRLPHALLFYGDAGVGKSRVAHQLAKFILSREAEPLSLLPQPPLYISADNHHGSLVAARSHPDFNVIELGDNKTIGVEAIREMIAFLRLKPVLGAWRVVIVDDFESMTRQAANSLLKILEDPPSHVIFILVAHGQVLPTIRSRCCVIPFQPLSASEVNRVLEGLGCSQLREQQAEAVQGRVALAMQLASELGSKVWQTLEDSQHQRHPGVAVQFAQEFAESIQDMSEIVLAWVGAQMRQVLAMPKQAQRWSHVWIKLRELFALHKQANMDATTTLYQAYCMIYQMSRHGT